MPSQRSHPGIVCQCEVCGKQFNPPWSSVTAGLQLIPGRGRFCDRKCGGVGRRGQRVPLKERFWKYVNKDGPLPADGLLGNCWVWTGALTTGYGRILVGGQNEFESAHRLAFVWENGPVPDGMVIRHRCDRRSCVRPSHLEIGTVAENSRDWVERGAGVVEVSRLKRTPAERFWAKVNKGGPVQLHCPELGPCWEWTGAREHTGYGAFRAEGRSHRAHRFAWQLARGPIPDGSFVLHRCDHRPCVCLDHLRLGDAGDNARDTIAKGRHPFLSDPSRVLRGEASPSARITEAQAREVIRRRGLQTGGQVAREVGVTVAVVNNIWHGSAWKHLKQ